MLTDGLSFYMQCLVHTRKSTIFQCYVIRLHSVSVIPCSDSNAARILSRVSACSIHLRCVACSPSLNALSWYTCPRIDKKKKIQRQHDCIATSIICIVEKRITSENNAASNEKNVTMLKQLLHSFYDTILPENMYSHPVEVQS